MRKRKREKKSVRLKRVKRKMRDALQISKIVAGLKEGMTLTDLHRETGMAQKTIRKIIRTDPAAFTFLIMKGKQNG